MSTSEVNSEKTYKGHRFHTVVHLKIPIRSHHWHHDGPEGNGVSGGSGLIEGDKRDDGGEVAFANAVLFERLITMGPQRTAV